MLVDRRVLFDVKVPRRYVGFRLVIVVVRDEVLDGVVREELAHLGIQLRRQRLVRREHQRGAARARNDVRHRVRLARASHSEQRLECEAVAEPLRQLFDRLRLVAGRLEWLVQLERAVGKRRKHVLLHCNSALAKREC